MSRQCRAHGRVGVSMLGVHGKQMRMIESSNAHDRAKAHNDNALSVGMTRRCARDKRTWARA